MLTTTVQVILEWVCPTCHSHNQQDNIEETLEVECPECSIVSKVDKVPTIIWK